jgi:DNA-binding cell septation regulator SpoVG
MRIKLREISIIPIIPTKKGIVAFCNFVINDSFKVCDVAIATDLTNGGYRLVYPIKAIPPHNKTVQIFYPIKKEISDQIQIQVLNQFSKLTGDKDGKL